MLLDAFLFSNELSLLDLRLAELSEVVDRFVLVEATKTFRGDPKPLVFEENKERFRPYLDKIVHVVIDTMPEGPDPWERERFQRNAIASGLAQCSPSPRDLVIISDVDEIPDADTLRKLVQTGLPDGLYALEQEMYYYAPTFRWSRIWTASRILTYRSFQSSGLSVDAIRNAPSYTRIPRGGWHFSYLGDIKFIQDKLKSFSHQEFNTPEFTSEAHIRRCIETGKDLFNRPDQIWTYVPLETNPYLPKHIHCIT